MHKLDETEIINSYRNAKYPINQIQILAELNNVSVSEIKGIITKHNAEPREPLVKLPERSSKEITAEQNAIIIDMLSNGYSKAKIARTVNLSANGLHCRLYKLRKEGELPQKQSKEKTPTDTANVNESMRPSVTVK